jgi:hypothetical protein
VLRNLERDEVKHLCIMSAADAYLFGPRPWGRFLALVRKGLENFTNQKRSRSGGAVFGTNPVTAVEGIASHVLTEFFLRKWLRTIPLLTLTAVFETESGAPRLLAADLPPERQAEIDATLAAERARRGGLERWAPRARQQALAQRQTPSARDRQRDERVRNNWYAAGR